MCNYVLADLKRILLYIPRLIVTFTLLIFSAVILMMMTFEQATFMEFLSSVKQIMQITLIVFGLTTFATVFVDDFKAKTMQIAIGSGVPRYKVVLGKVLDVMTVQLFDFILLFIVFMIFALILNIRLETEHIMTMATFIFVGWLKIVAYTCVTMIIVFAVQGTTIGIVAYIAISLGLASEILSTIITLGGLAPYHLNRFTLTSLLNIFGTRLSLGSFDVGIFLGILIYIGLSLVLAMILFSKRELEF